MFVPTNVFEAGLLIMFCFLSACGAVGLLAITVNDIKALLKDLKGIS